MLSLPRIQDGRYQSAERSEMRITPEDPLSLARFPFSVLRRCAPVVGYAGQPKAGRSADIIRRI